MKVCRLIELLKAQDPMAEVVIWHEENDQHAPVENVTNGTFDIENALFLEGDNEPEYPSAVELS